MTYRVIYPSGRVEQFNVRAAGYLASRISHLMDSLSTECQRALRKEFRHQMVVQQRESLLRVIRTSGEQ